MVVTGSLPAWLGPGVRNPRHLELDGYLALARGAAARAARRNGVPIAAEAVRFPGGGPAPTRVEVRVEGEAPMPDALGRAARPGGATGRHRARDRDGASGRRGAARRASAAPPVVRARAVAELVPDPAAGAYGPPSHATGGGYSGPLAYRMGKPMRPDVAHAFDRMAAAARREAGVHLAINSAFRSDREQARLWAANPNPRWVAPPGTSLHRYATELDLGPPAAYAWLKRNSRRFGFIHRYAWEDWHYESAYTRTSAAGRDHDSRRAYTSTTPAGGSSRSGGRVLLSAGCAPAGRPQMSEPHRPSVR